MQGTSHPSGAVVAHPSGELDLATAPGLESALLTLLGESNGTLVIDLRDVTFVDSSGLSAFVRAHKRAQVRGGRLLLAAAGDHVAQVLDVVGLGILIPVYPSVEAALASAAAKPA